MQYLLVAIVDLVVASCPDHWEHTDNHDCSCRGLFLRDYDSTELLWDHEGYCEAEGYIPGGGPIIIEDFEAPVVKLQQNAIGNIAKDLGFGIDVGSDLMDIASACKEVAKNVKILASSLGIFGSVFSMFSPKPSVDDILDAVNEAFQELTKEVNDQFANMKGYVDQQILEASKDRWEDAYSGYYNEFKGCLKFDPQGWNETVNCMELVDNDAGSNYATFMDFLNEMDDDKYSPSVEDIKKMEVQFSVYNNYAQLRMMMLLSLYGAYKDEDAMPPDWFQVDAFRAMAKTYLQALRDESLKYKKYNTFIHDKITHKYSMWRREDLQGTVECSQVYDKCVASPVIHRNLYYEITCWGRFDDVSLLSSQTCSLPMRIACKGQNDHWVKIVCADLANCGGSKEQFAEKAYILETSDKFLKYHNAINSQVRSYWEANALVERETYQQIHDEAVKRLEAYADVYASPPSYTCDLPEPTVDKNKVEL